jgi:hypothetical protein
MEDPEKGHPQDDGEGGGDEQEGEAHFLGADPLKHDPPPVDEEHPSRQRHEVMEHAAS